MYCSTEYLLAGESDLQQVYCSNNVAENNEMEFVIIIPTDITYSTALYCTRMIFQWANETKLCSWVEYCIIVNKTT